jgi:hypothetical protein
MRPGQTLANCSVRAGRFPSHRVVRDRVVRDYFRDRVAVSVGSRADTRTERHYGGTESRTTSFTEIWQSNPDGRFLSVLEGELTAESVDPPFELPEAEPPAVAQVSFGAGCE